MAVSENKKDSSTLKISSFYQALTRCQHKVADANATEWVKGVFVKRMWVTGEFGKAQQSSFHHVSIYKLQQLSLHQTVTGIGSIYEDEMQIG